MKTLIYIAGCFIPLIFACQPDDDTSRPLHYAPTGKVFIERADTTIMVDFSLDERMYSVISSKFVENQLERIKTREDLISYYPTLNPTFKPGYSSSLDYNEYIFTKAEYLLAQECFHDDCSSQTRKGILTIAVRNQKQKFGVPFISPFLTRNTGAFLIALILVKEGDISFIQSLRNDADLQKTLLCLNSDVFIDEEINNKLILRASIFLGLHYRKINN